MITMNSNQFYDRYKRDPEAKRFYNSKAWKVCRELVLQRDNYLCVHHLKRNQIVAADMVHHIKELREHPDLSLEPSNLVSLCFSCHEEQHPDRGKIKKQVSKKLKIIQSKKNPEII